MSKRRWGSGLAFAFLLLAGACTSSIDPDSSSPQSTSEVAGDSTQPSAAAPSPVPSTDPNRDAPDLATLPGRLVVRTSAGALVLIEPDGEVIDELAPGGVGVHSQATWSREGDRVAWSTIDSGGSSISIWSDGDQDSRDLALLPPPFFYSWAPGGDTLATLRQGSAGVEMGLVTEDQDYEPVANGQPFFFDWADDGASLTAAINGSIIATVTPGEDTSVDPIEIDRSLGLFQAPSVLSDGRIAVPVDSSSDGDFDLVIIDPATAAIEPLATGRGLVFVAESSDGRLAVLPRSGAGSDDDVVVVRFQEITELEAGRVSIVDPSTKAVSTLSETDAIAMTWSPDGERLAILQVETEGLRWVFTDGSATDEGLTFIPSSDFLNSYLPFAEQYAKNTNWWSPDGSAFVFAGTIADVEGVFVDVVGDGLEPALVSDGNIVSWSPK